MRKYSSVSIVIPVYNGGFDFAQCLAAVQNFKPAQWELLVVDDGSTDRSASIAAAAGATLLHTMGRLGPGGARNIGAQSATGEYLCFIDADCEVNEFTFANIAEEILEYRDVDAFFGSYDDTPRAENFVAQYKNLSHRYVHQIANEDASTFWAGCGIVRRSTFLSVGGFDTTKFSRPSIEDIDLGYRIKQAGGKIRIAKSVQVKHYKAWSFYTLVKTDVVDRGIPWTRLLLANPTCRVNDLNLQLSQRLSVVCTFTLLACLLAAVVKPILLLGALASCVAMWILNRDIYRYFYEYRGLNFLLKVIPMQWLYYFYAGIGFSLLGFALHCMDRLQGIDPYLLHPQPPLRSKLVELGRPHSID